MTAARQVLVSFIVLVITLTWFELTPTDLWVQNFLFNDSNQSWLLQNPPPVIHFIFYDGIKGVLVISLLALVVAMLFSGKSQVVKQYRQGLRIVIISLIIVPSVVALFKSTTNVACPRDITVYGGDVPYVRLFEPYPENQRPENAQQCFPAGHASGGFALMSLFYLFQSRRNRNIALLFGLSLGSLMGGYKMLLGHHFLSHTLVTMISAWLLINSIVIVDRFIASKISWPAEKQRAGL